MSITEDIKISVSCGQQNPLGMIHQPLGGFQGQASDIEIHAQEILLMKKKVNEILSKHTGKNLKTVEKDTDRNNFLNAEEAKKYGIIDDILEERS